MPALFFFRQGAALISVDIIDYWKHRSFVELWSLSQISTLQMCGNWMPASIVIFIFIMSAPGKQFSS